MYHEIKKENLVGDLENIKKLDKYLVGHKGFIAGGCFKDIINGKDFNDIDIYFNKEKDFKEARDYFRKGSKVNWEVAYETPNTLCLKSSTVKIDIIKIFYSNKKDLLEDFDFTVTKAVYDGKTFMYHKRFLSDCENKILCLDNKIKFPLRTLIRSYKYRDYGYKLNLKSLKKLTMKINKLSEQIINNDDNYYVYPYRIIED